jgi:hypothetical protein
MGDLDTRHGTMLFDDIDQRGQRLGLCIIP